jgi:hypothetical protein
MPQYNRRCDPFTDIVGYTGMITTKNALQSWIVMQCLNKLITDHGGKILKIMGMATLFFSSAARLFIVPCVFNSYCKQI